MNCYQCQHGFRKGHSTATNMLQCDAYIADCLNKGKSIDLIMIDFQRAFDKVDHNLLLHKLNLIGISGCYLRWFANLLTDRWQFVEYNFKRSAAVPCIIWCHSRIPKWAYTLQHIYQ